VDSQYTTIKNLDGLIGGKKAESEEELVEMILDAGEGHSLFCANRFRTLPLPYQSIGTIWTIGSP
jgi:hypothetical protein